LLCLFVAAGTHVVYFIKEGEVGYQEIVYRKENHVATITLNRPEATDSAPAMMSSR